MARTTRLIAGLSAAALVSSGAIALAPAADATPRPAITNSCKAALPTSVEGAPTTFKAGAAEGVYLWHDAKGWHVRATHDQPAVNGKKVKVEFRGVVGASRPISNVRAVRLEADQRGEWFAVSRPARQVLQFRFVNFGGIDGLNFAAGCAGRVNATFWKVTKVEGKVVRVPVKVFVGKDATELTSTTVPALKATPADASSFTVLRTA